jgi:hypothetical protein
MDQSTELAPEDGAAIRALLGRMREAGGKATEHVAMWTQPRRPIDRK